MANIKFILNGCDIFFVDKVYDSDVDTEIKIGYDSVEKVNADVSCSIKE